MNCFGALYAHRLELVSLREVGWWRHLLELSAAVVRNIDNLCCHLVVPFNTYERVWYTTPTPFHNQPRS